MGPIALVELQAKYRNKDFEWGFLLHPKRKTALFIILFITYFLFLFTLSIYTIYLYCILRRFFFLK